MAPMALFIGKEDLLTRIYAADESPISLQGVAHGCGHSLFHLRSDSSVYLKHVALDPFHVVNLQSIYDERRPCRA